uniref:Uncharacterized protein n=1 Tax=Seriola lalandi dorsalis TaxID=1841481 RepID=A0A3B4XPB4_SERLL
GTREGGGVKERREGDIQTRLSLLSLCNRESERERENTTDLCLTGSLPELWCCCMLWLLINSLFKFLCACLKTSYILILPLKNHFYYVIVVVDVRTHCTLVSSSLNVLLSSALRYLISSEHDVTLSDSFSGKQEKVVLLSVGV